MVQISSVNVHTITSGDTFGADEELLRELKKRTQLNITHWLDSYITIVFCPIVSRVGSDVEAAMNLVTALDQKVILVLMHHTRDESYSTAGIMWSERYPNVILDVHVLFHETVHGLLKCANNTRAINEIIPTLLSQSQQTEYPDDESQTQGLLRRRNVIVSKRFPDWRIVIGFIVVIFIILLLVIFLSKLK